MPARPRDEGTDAQVFFDAQARKQPPVFGDVRNALLDDAVRRQATGRVAVERHRPAAHRHQPGNDAHEGGLAGAVRPDHTDNFTLRHFERDPEQGLEGCVAGGHVGEGEHAIRPAPCRDRPR